MLMIFLSRWKSWVKHARHVLKSRLSNPLVLMEVLISLTIQFLKIFGRNVGRPADFTRPTWTDERMGTDPPCVRDWCTRNAVDPLPADEMKSRHIVEKHNLIVALIVFLFLNSFLVWNSSFSVICSVVFPLFCHQMLFQLNLMFDGAGAGVQTYDQGPLFDLEPCARPEGFPRICSD